MASGPLWATIIDGQPVTFWKDGWRCGCFYKETDPIGTCVHTVKAVRKLYAENRSLFMSAVMAQTAQLNEEIKSLPNPGLRASMGENEGFGFAIPGGATITGIEVSLRERLEKSKPVDRVDIKVSYQEPKRVKYTLNPKRKIKLED